MSTTAMTIKTLSTRYDPSSIIRKSRLISATSPLDVEINNIRSKIYETVYDIVLNDNTDYLSIDFIDKAKHKSHIEIYDSVNHCCSCDLYCRSGTGTCKHLEILKLIAKNPASAAENEIVDYIETISKRLDRHKKSKNYIFFNGMTRKILRIKTDPAYCDHNSYSIDTYNKNYTYSQTEDESVLFTDNYILSKDITLFDYQTEILQKLLRVKRGLCSMTMGSGKTLMSIAGMHYLNTSNVLIVCPKSIALQWQEEISRNTGFPTVIATSANISTIPDDVITIVSYQTFMRNVDAFKTRHYKMCIADEIQYIRNDESKIWSAFRKIDCEYFWGLSGTLIENKLDDLYNVLEIVRPGMLGPKWSFDAKYKPITSVHNMKVLYENSIQNLEELKKEISGCVFAYDGLVLPKIHKQVIRIDMIPEARKMHNDAINSAAMLVAKSLSRGLSFKERAMVQAYYLKARQCCNTLELLDSSSTYTSPKIDAVIAKIVEIIKTGNNVVVYSEWTSMLSIIEDRLRSNKISYQRYDGSMNTQKRKDAIDTFKASNGIVFTSSDAGSIGVDGLQMCCNHIIHIELPWNPAKLDQRNGRLHRLKQVNEVYVYNFVTNDSIETKIEKLLDQKKKIRYEALYEH